MKVNAYSIFVAGILIPSCLFAMPTIKNNYGAAENNIATFETKPGSADYVTTLSARQKQTEHLNEMPLMITDTDNPIIFADADMLAEITGIGNYSGKLKNSTMLINNNGQATGRFFTPENANYTQMNFGAYEYISNPLNGSKTANKWELDAQTRDSKLLQGGTVVVPAPGALLLCAIGAVIIGWLRKSRMMA